jgi:hypothetical protein
MLCKEKGAVLRGPLRRNADHPVGTMQSIEHTLRALDRAPADEQQQLKGSTKLSPTIQAGANRPFEMSRG